MRNKPARLYLLLNEQAENEPYRVGGEVKVYNSKGKAIKKAKLLYNTEARLFTVVRAGLTLRREHADAYQA